MTSSHVLQRRGQPSTAEQGLTDSLAFRLIVTALFVILAFWLTGCSASFEPKLSGGEPGGPGGTVGNVLKGQIHGGQQPVAGAYVFVFQVGEAGYPGPGVQGNQSIISSTTTGSFNGSIDGNSYGSYVLSDADGNFSFNLNNCTLGDGVYIVSLGGQAITGETNPAESEMAPLGICPAGGISALIASTPFVNLNEVSTVAFAYAMAGFTAAGMDFSHISTSATNITGMQNAFMLAEQLFSVNTTGGANTSSAAIANAIFPAAKINTMGNILADCINSAGVTGSSSPCYTLFQNATSSGVANSGTIPSDTASAMINITHNVVSNVSTLYGLANNTYAPFSPTLTGTPTDFAMTIKYTAPNMYDPFQLAIDSTGAVYALNYLNSSGAAAPSITKFVPGAGFLGTTTLSSVANIALDQSNNIFLLNNVFSSNLPTVTEYTSSNTAALGSAVSSPPSLPSGVSAIGYTTLAYGSDLLQPMILVGPTNNVEVDDLNAIYNAPYSSGYGTATKISGTSANNVFGFAINGLGTTYFQSAPSGYVYAVTNSGTTTPLYAYPNAFWNLALDPESRAAIYGFNGNNSSGLLFLSNSAFNGSVATFNGAGILNESPNPPVFDGLGTAWITSSAAGSCAVQSISPSGFATNTVNYGGYGIYSDGVGSGSCNGDGANTVGQGIDQAGNLWLGVRTPAARTVSGYLLEVLGVAAPTIQPLSLQSARILPSNASFDIRP